MNLAEYLSYDGLGLAQLVEARQVSAEQLLEFALSRLDALNPVVNAVIHRMESSARAEAAAPNRGGPFGGVPFLVKDLGQTVQGERMRAGSRFLADYVSDHDSELMRRYRRAGFVTMGKTNTPEFGLTPYTEPMLFGPTRNPWDLSRTSGGSSGGSAAAVAAGIVPIASGGDGGGSIRIPASCCGLFGLKPSRGRIPTGPDAGEYWHGAVVEHVLTRSVRDSAAVLDAIHGADPGAPYLITDPERPYLEEVSRDPGQLRIAVTAHPFLGGSVHPDCRAALEDAARLLADLGHQVTEDAPDIDGRAFSLAFLSMVAAETAAELREAEVELGRRASSSELEPETWALTLLGGAITAEQLSRALRHLGTTARTVGRFFERYDVLVTPTLAVPPFPIGALQPKPWERSLVEVLGKLGSGRLIRAAGLLEQMAGQVFDAIPYTPLFNATGQPGMSVPLAWNGEGLPIGIQCVARLGEEGTLYRLAGQLEQARPWFDRLAPLARGEV
ncbi:MAG: amidase [Gemmatimonadales bacterium]|nr:amidase [Gemmatimonadales bacterium]